MGGMTSEAVEAVNAFLREIQAKASDEKTAARITEQVQGQLWYWCISEEPVTADEVKQWLKRYEEK